jgi:Bacterial transglutaminase-like N-terminal region
MLRPDDSHDLRLHHAALAVDPEPSLVHWTHDVFDNSICLLEWPQALKTNRLKHRLDPRFDPSSGWTAIARL